MNWALQLNINQLGNSFNSHLEKQFILILPSQSNLPKLIEIAAGQPVAQDVVVGALQEEPSSSDSTGQPVAKGRNNTCKLTIARGNPKAKKHST